MGSNTEPTCLNLQDDHYTSDVVYQFNDNLFYSSKCDEFSQCSSVAEQVQCTKCPCSFSKKTQNHLAHFQLMQTYGTVKYFLMAAILLSIVDGLFTLGYQQQFLREIQFGLYRVRAARSGVQFQLLLLNEEKLRVATGLLYLINVLIQLIGLAGVNYDHLLITCSYSIYSFTCFVFTIGAYLTQKRLIISLCINCLLAILSTMFAIFVKKLVQSGRNKHAFRI